MQDVKMTTKRRGWIGESVVARNLIEKGFGVYVPLVDDSGIDMVVDTGKNLKRVQVKTRISTASTSVEVKVGKHKNSNIDVIAIYYAPKDIIAYYPYNNEDSVYLALSTAKNNQESGRSWFYRYMEFPV